MCLHQLYCSADTAWNADALDLHFDCRTDATYASHEHADHGQFTFDADGCAWAITGIRDTETKYHNCVTIDGHGQGYFPPPGKWIGLNQTDAGVVGAVNTKYCWDWFWPKPIMLEPPSETTAWTFTPFVTLIEVCWPRRGLHRVWRCR